MPARAHAWPLGRLALSASLSERGVGRLEKQCSVSGQAKSREARLACSCAGQSRCWLPAAARVRTSKSGGVLCYAAAFRGCLPIGASGLSSERQGGL